MTNAYMTAHMGISESTAAMAAQAEADITAQCKTADDIAAFNQMKVLHAMRKNRLSEIHFSVSTGYGYHDHGREVLENIYADIFRAEAGLVRPQMISGTHALTAALFGNLRPGDELLLPVGKPYDTLEGVIGMRPTPGSLVEYGITYRQVDLTPDGEIDYAQVEKHITKQTKMAAIQRSKGYGWRRSFSVEEIGKLIAFIKGVNPSIICMVDNCYGEFVEVTEPTEVGADMAVGSLIKNPGGGLAPAGGYIVGKEAYVTAAAERLTAPGLGREVGPTLGLTATLLQGLFLAPQVVSGCVKGAVLAARIFEQMGFAVNPGVLAPRTDIVQAIRLGCAEAVLAFCRGVQNAAPVDGFVTPEAAPMPGYDCPVVMAAGCFIQGSSIELSADAPLKPPYIVYFQGGLTWPHARAGVVFALEALRQAGFGQCI